jgi:hypothetical protein
MSIHHQRVCRNICAPQLTLGSLPLRLLALVHSFCRCELVALSLHGFLSFGDVAEENRARAKRTRR